MSIIAGQAIDVIAVNKVQEEHTLRFLKTSQEGSKLIPIDGEADLGAVNRWYEIQQDPDIWALIDAGKIVLGGCCISGDDPKWKCADCGVDIYKKEKTIDDLINS